LSTGASRGIGAATALQAARAGYAVALNYRTDTAAAKQVLQQLHALGATAIGVQADVACRVEAMGFARLQRMFNTNVIGSMVCAREAVLRMSTRHGRAGGAIVNVSSIAATLGSPGQYVDYAASIPMQRSGTADEVASATLWLLGPGAGYTTGALLDVGCGR
jgi:NAD(P)-dependent dehydrogenase (short-subunit alcohol dehydrogenase family)